jgi:hypothetical protein
VKGVDSIYRTLIFDLPPRRARRRSIYLTELVARVSPLEPEEANFRELLELLFPEVDGKSTKLDSQI